MLLQRATLPLFGFLLALRISEARDNSLAYKLQVETSWKALDFAYPSQEDRQKAIDNNQFTPGKALPVDIDVYYKNATQKRIFIAIPRGRKGVPITLGYVTNNRTSDGSLLVAPYPSWVWQGLDNCNRLISVYGIQVDRCNRLWVIDSGKLGKSQVCPPKLLSFSLDTEELISTYVFPKTDYAESSLLVTPVVDARGEKCEDTFVYVTDIEGFGLIVYDNRHFRSWKVSNNLFYPYPEFATISVQGIVFDRMEGIVTGALTPFTPDGDRYLLFHSVSSRTESYVLTSVLRNQSLFENNPYASPRSFVPFKNKRSSQSIAEATDMNGVLYFGLVKENAIACWNSKYWDYGKNSIEKIAVNSKTLQFPMAVKVVREKNGSEILVVLANSFQRYINGTLDPTKTNFRILVGMTDQLIKGTKCDGTYRTGPL